MLFRAFFAKRQHLYVHNLLFASICACDGKRKCAIQIQELFDIRFFHRYFHQNAHFKFSCINLSKCNRKWFDRIFLQLTVVCIASHQQRYTFLYCNKIIVKIEMCLICVSKAPIVHSSAKDYKWQNSSLTTFHVDFQTTVLAFFDVVCQEMRSCYRCEHFISPIFRKLYK